jgi:hypothetical protein
VRAAGQRLGRGAAARGLSPNRPEIRTAARWRLGCADARAPSCPGAGIAVAPSAAGTALVSGGSLTANCTAGLSAQRATAVADAVLITGNATGVAAGDGGLIQLARSTITNNATGVTATGSGQIQAWPGNAVAPNTVPGFTPGTLPFS